MCTVNTKTFFLFAVWIAIIASCWGQRCGDCDTGSCEDPGPCEYGDTTDDCRCCPVCYKGPGEECGTRWSPDDKFIGYCAYGMTCVVKHSGEVGTCMHWKDEKAWRCGECNPEKCEDPGPCEYGDTTDGCGCCPVCYKGPGEECGLLWSPDDKFIGWCAYDMTCAVKHSGEVGTCMHWMDANAWRCGECDPEKCEDPGSCEYGDTIDDCRCCPVCLKGPGEECGPRWKPEDEFIGSCAGNMTCLVKRPGEKGMCIDWEAEKAWKCNECNLENCEDPGPCEYGDTTDDCDCCSICSKGPGEECGERWSPGDEFIGYCASNLFCVFQDSEEVGTCIE